MHPLILRAAGIVSELSSHARTAPFIAGFMTASACLPQGFEKAHAFGGLLGEPEDVLKTPDAMDKCDDLWEVLQEYEDRLIDVLEDEAFEEHFRALGLDEAGIREWCQGFTLAANLPESLYEEKREDEDFLDCRFGMTMIEISGFPDDYPDLKENPDYEDCFKNPGDLAVQMVEEINEYWLDWAVEQDAAEEAEEAESRPVSKPAKVGPNQPCPCGSGKKYKKCCG